AQTADRARGDSQRVVPQAGCRLATPVGKTPGLDAGEGQQHHLRQAWYFSRDGVVAGRRVRNHTAAVDERASSSRSLESASTPCGAQAADPSGKARSVMQVSEASTHTDLAHSIRISATSGLLNSIGGLCPALSISRTFVPLGATLSSGPCGQVFWLTTASHFLHQAVCSNLRMVTPMSLGRSN